MARFRFLDGHRPTNANDCVMNSEEGALVRGSDPPSGHSVDVHNTTGDMWRAPARRLMPKPLAAAVYEIDDYNASNRPFFRFRRRA